MGILRKASVETKKIALPVEYETKGKEKIAVLRDPAEGEDWIAVRTDIAKRDFNRFVSYLPGRTVSTEEGMTPAEATELQKGLFETLVTGWSLEEAATLEAYESLSNEGASAIDTALAEHFKALQPSAQEEKVGFRPK
jgi:hypothetical protein